MAASAPPPNAPAQQQALQQQAGSSRQGTSDAGTGTTLGTIAFSKSDLGRYVLMGFGTVALVFVVVVLITTNLSSNEAPGKRGEYRPYSPSSPKSNARWLPKDTATDNNTAQKRGLDSNNSSAVSDAKRGLAEDLSTPLNGNNNNAAPLDEGALEPAEAESDEGDASGGADDDDDEGADEGGDEDTDDDPGARGIIKKSGNCTQGKNGTRCAVVKKGVATKKPNADARHLIRPNNVPPKRKQHRTSSNRTGSNRKKPVHNAAAAVSGSSATVNNNPVHEHEQQQPRAKMERGKTEAATLKSGNGDKSGNKDLVESAVIGNKSPLEGRGLQFMLENNETVSTLEKGAPAASSLYMR